MTPPLNIIENMYSARQRFRRLGAKSVVAKEKPSSVDSSSVAAYGGPVGATSYPISQEKFPFQTSRASALDNQRLDLTLVTACSPTVNNHSTKKVSFQSTVKVVLIPHLSEYESAGLRDNLWYGDDDITAFKCEAFQIYQQLQLYLNKSSNAEKSVPLSNSTTPWVA